MPVLILFQDYYGFSLRRDVHSKVRVMKNSIGATLLLETLLVSHWWCGCKVVKVIGEQLCISEKHGCVLAMS
jgi:hypothetical protein